MSLRVYAVLLVLFVKATVLAADNRTDLANYTDSANGTGSANGTDSANGIYSTMPNDDNIVPGSECGNSYCSTGNKTAPTENISETTTHAENRIEPKLMTRAEYEEVNKIINYMNYPVEFIGIIFCLFSVIVYSRKVMRSPSSIFLAAVNLSELVNVLIIVVWEVSATIYGTERGSSLIYLIINFHGHIFINTAVKRSTYCYIFLLTLERFLAVSFPLKYRNLKLLRRPLLVPLVTFFAVLAFHVFVPLKFHIYEQTVGSDNWSVTLSELFKTQNTLFNAFSMASKILFVFMPLLCSLILTVGTAIALRRHGRKRKDMVGGDDADRAAKERQTTITIVTSSLIFLVLAMPTNVVLFIGNVSTTLSDIGSESIMYTALIRIGGWFELLTNCVDFICYITISSQFRKTFLALFSRCTQTLPESGSVSDITKQSTATSMDSVGSL